MKSKTSEPLPDAGLAELQQLWAERRDNALRHAALTVASPRLATPRRAASRLRRRRLGAAAVVLVCLAALAASALLYRSVAVDLVLQLTMLALMAVYAVVALAVGVPLRRSLRRHDPVAVGRFATLPLPQVGTFSAAAMLALVIVATSPVGDGYVMTQNYHGRAEAVAAVNQMLSLA